ncbi:MAG: Hsp20/alpha crystallin family protein [Deferribacterota bacterium]|nr:Hsp20/alpha crystallin family protein [Deferribacterota bacterium]
MANLPWDQFKDMFSLQNALNELFEGGFYSSSTSIDGEWSPPVDIYENDEEVVIMLEIPGVEKDEIDIFIDENMLKIEGVKNPPYDNKKEDIYRLECPYGKFKRVFNIGVRVDKNKVNASYNDGVLKIVLPKDDTSKQKKIDIVKEG